MEILVVVVAALATLLVPLVLLMAEIAVLGASALVEAGAYAREYFSTGSVDAARKSRAERHAATAGVRRWAWWTVLASAGSIVVTLLVLVVLNSLAFNWVVARAVKSAGPKSGIAVTFDDAEGSLLSGRVKLRDAKFVRTGNPISDFDLDVAQFDVDADVWRLLAGEIKFEEITVSGVRGHLIRNGKRDPKLPRRRFTVNRLSVSDVAIEVTDLSRPPHEVSVPVAVESLAIEDFRSWWAAFDMLFRSTAKGLVDGQPFAITSGPVEGGGVEGGAGDEYQTQWLARDMPVHLVSGYFTGPLGWLVDGRLDVEVTTRWRRDESDPNLEMHCILKAHGFAAELPEELAKIQKLFVEPAVDALNQSQRQLPLEFDLVMQKDAFRDQLSPITAGLVDAMVQASTKSIAQIVPPALEQIGERVDQIRSLIQERRRARAERRAAEERQRDADADED